MFDLKNKTVVITGGAGLIGSAFSRICAESGANTVILDNNEENGSKLAEEIKNKTGKAEIIFKKCSIIKKNEIQESFNSVLDKFGTIDALVNSAYPKNKNYGRKMEEVSYEDFCENVNWHLGGYFLVDQQAAEIMIKQNHGNIINLASTYGFAAPRFEIYQGTSMTVPVEYAAIKGGIINLTKYLASYLGKYNIRVNAISPGGVFDNQPKEFVEKYIQKVILEKRMANTDDLAGVLLFLLSDASKYITGQNIVADGGWTL